MSYGDEIEVLRNEINRLNKEIIDKLAERVNVAKHIGEVKTKYGKPIVDLSREEKVYEKIRDLAKDKGLDPEDVTQIFKAIIRLCTEVQKND